MLLALSAPALVLPTTPSFSRPAVGRASLLTMQVDTPTAPKTVGDAKTAFQASYGNRPVGMMLHSFVNELLSSNVLATGRRPSSTTASSHSASRRCATPS